MNKIGLYRYAVTVSVSVLILVAVGSLVTTEGIGTAIPDWPLAFGKVWPMGPYPSGVPLVLAHRALAAASLASVAGLVIYARKVKAMSYARHAGLAAFALMLLQVLTGGAAVLYRFPPWMGVFHALLAQLCFFLVAAVAVFTSPIWVKTPEQVSDYGWPSLRTLALWCPVLVFIQMFLGALYRHHITGIIPHILGALIVGGLVLLFALFVVTQFPKHQSLKFLAASLLSAIVVQAALGVFTYVVGALADEQAGRSIWGDLVIAGHVATGGVVFASCALLGIQVRRCVLPKFAPATEVQAVS